MSEPNAQDSDALNHSRVKLRSTKSCLKSSTPISTNAATANTSRNHSLHLELKPTGENYATTPTTNNAQNERSRRSLSTFPQLLNYTDANTNSKNEKSVRYYDKVVYDQMTTTTTTLKSSSFKDEVYCYQKSNDSNNNDTCYANNNDSSTSNSTNTTTFYSTLNSNQDESPTYSISFDDMEIFNRLTHEQLNVDNSRWLSEKPLSVLMLDSADRAVLKIAGKTFSLLTRLKEYKY
jgi:hypothetical protein